VGNPECRRVQNSKQVLHASFINVLCSNSTPGETCKEKIIILDKVDDEKITIQARPLKDNATKRV
jgi:hypothetical protein